MLPLWLQNKTIAVYDLETPLIPTEGILAIPNIYCLSITLVINEVAQPAKLFTEYWTPYSNGSLLQGMALLNSADIAIAHNGVSFDSPVIENVLGVRIKPLHLDTLIISKLVFSKDELSSIDYTLQIDSDLIGSYSLKAFGKRLGNDKIQFEDFSQGLTEAMGTYCKQDTDLTAQLFLFLANHNNFPIEPVIEIEHKAAVIIQKQEQYGFYIDIDKARALNTKLLQEKFELATELATMFSPKFLADGPVKSYKKQSKVKKYLPNPDYKRVW